MNDKGKKTTATAIASLVLGLVAFALWVMGKIDAVELVGSIAFITFIGGIIGQIFSKDVDATHSNEDKNTYAKVADHLGDRPNDR